MTRELDAVKQESLLLREQMRSVKQDIENVSNWFCHFFACLRVTYKYIYIYNKSKMLFWDKLAFVTNKQCMGIFFKLIFSLLKN